MAEEILFKILKERPMSVSELARRLNIRREYLAGYLEALRNSGKLERILVGRSYVYRPVERNIHGHGQRHGGLIMAGMPEEEEEE